MTPKKKTPEKKSLFFFTYFHEIANEQEKNNDTKLEIEYEEIAVKEVNFLSRTVIG